MGRGGRGFIHRNYSVPTPGFFQVPGAPGWQVTTVGCESGWKPEVNCQVTALNMSQVMSSPLLAGGPQSAWLPVRNPGGSCTQPPAPACRRHVPTTPRKAGERRR